MSDDVDIVEAADEAEARRVERGNSIDLETARRYAQEVERGAGSAWKHRHQPHYSDQMWVEQLALVCLAMLDQLDQLDVVSHTHPGPNTRVAPSFAGLFAHMTPAPTPVAPDKPSYASSLIEGLSKALGYPDNSRLGHERARAALACLRAQGWQPPAASTPTADVAQALNRINAQAQDERDENAEIGRLVKLLPHAHALHHPDPDGYIQSQSGEWWGVADDTGQFTEFELHPTPLAALRAMVEKLAKG